MADYYRLSVEKVLNELTCNLNGLSEEETKKRLKKFGLNELKEKKKINALILFLNQFKSALIYVLIAAGIINLFIGELDGAILVAIIVVVNAFIGFYQESKAEKALEALKKLTISNATVIRNGVEELVDSKHLVPGDIILVEEGEIVAADARIIEAINLRVDEAVLTGESTPVGKIAEVIEKEKIPIAEQKNILFAGTTIVKGRGKAIVIATGQFTEFGKIAESLQSIEETKTPLVEKMDKLGTFLAKIAVVLIIIIFLLGMLAGSELIKMFLIAIGLAVAAIPEGLPAVVTIALALGTQAMARGNAVIRKLAAVETLGSTTVICSDKTGTITKNELMVQKVFDNFKEFNVSGEGYNLQGEISLNQEKILTPSKELELISKISVLCNNAHIGETKKELIGDPTEIALLVLGKKLGFTKENLKEEFLDELEFDSNRKMMSVEFNAKGKHFLYSKGSAEAILERSTFFMENGKQKKLDKKKLNEFLEKNNELASKGLRVLGFAFKERKEKGKLELRDEKDLIFVGLVGMIDSPHKESLEAIALCRKAGIQVKMVTGDHLLTAIAIAKQIKLIEENVDLKKVAIEGKELDKLSEEELAKKINELSVFARVSPEHKVKIINALRKQNNNVIAMTGDGVNDAPALKNADIGVVMGIKGTDVAKQVADMVLLDDNFSTIVKAVREGRKIYSNIKNSVKYLLSANFGEILTISIAQIISIAFGLHIGLPLGFMQLLWINLVTDLFPALALSKEEISDKVMEEKPRNPKEDLLHGIFGQILIIAIIVSIVTLLAFAIGLKEGGLILGQTMALTTMILFELIFVFNCRGENTTLFNKPFYANKWLVLAVIISFIAHLIVLNVPLLQKFFEVTNLNLIQWIIVFILGLSAILVPYINNIANKLISKIQRNPSA